MAVAAVAVNETFALLRPCLSHFQSYDVGIEINQAWKLIAPAIVVAAMALGIFSVFIGYDISRQRGTQQDQHSSCKMYSVMTNQSVTPEINPPIEMQPSQT